MNDSTPTLQGSALHYLERLQPHLEGDPDTLMLGTLTRRDLRNVHAVLSNMIPLEESARADERARCVAIVECMRVTSPRPEQGELETHLEWQRRWKDWRIAQDETNTTLDRILSALVTK